MGKCQAQADLLSEQERKLREDFGNVEQEMTKAHLEMITNREAAKV